MSVGGNKSTYVPNVGKKESKTYTQPVVFEGLDLLIHPLEDTLNGEKGNILYSTQDKKLNQGEIEKIKKSGIDIHDLKPNSTYDLFKDKKGDILVKPKNGSGGSEPTNLNIKDF